MSEYIAYFIALINELTGNNQFLTTTIIGGAAVAMRKVPRRIYSAIRFRLRYSVTLDTGSSMPPHVSRALEKIIDEYKINWGSRVGQIKTFLVRTGSFEIRPGLGTTICLHEGGIIWVHKKDLPSDGSDGNKYRFTVSTFGFSSKRIHAFLASREKEPDMSTISVRSQALGFSTEKKISYKDLSISESDINFISGQIASFEQGAEFAEKHNIDHKLVIVLPGEPGTGKSTMAKLIASEMNSNLYMASMCKLDFKDSTEAIRSRAKWDDDRPPVLLLEDLHSNGNLYRDELIDSTNPDLVDLQTLLGTLQGPVRIKNLIVVMTTNDMEKLHPAIFRNGRVTAVHELSRISPEQVKDNLAGAFGKEMLNLEITTAWRGCDLAFFKQSYFSKVASADVLVKYIEQLLPPEPEMRNYNLSDFALNEK